MEDEDDIDHDDIAAAHGLNNDHMHNGSNEEMDPNGDDEDIEGEIDFDNIDYD
jgi:hypothetical protein